MADVKVWKESGMSAYDNDDRVTPNGPGFTADDGGDEFIVLPTRTLGWQIVHPNFDYVWWDEATPAVGYPSADAALHAVVGDPRPTILYRETS